VCMYLRFTLRFRDVEELLAERNALRICPSPPFTSWRRAPLLPLSSTRFSLVRSIDGRTRVADLLRPSVRRDVTPLNRCPVSPRSQLMRRTLPSDPEAAQAVWATLAAGPCLRSDHPSHVSLPGREGRGWRVVGTGEGEEGIRPVRGVIVPGPVLPHTPSGAAQSS
jgi:hypothetical protein